jgi:hypothetical protein
MQNNNMMFSPTTSETASEMLQLPPIKFLVPKSDETNRKGQSLSCLIRRHHRLLHEASLKKNVAFEASFSHVVGAGLLIEFKCIQHVLIAELHLAFQPFVKFPHSRNSAFKVFLEGAAPVPVMVLSSPSSSSSLFTILSVNVCRLVVLVFGG